MPQRDDATLLRDMLDASRAALQAAAGRGKSEVAADQVWALGLVKCIEIVGEAAGRLSSEFRGGHEEIPWPQIIGMRNRLVHAYFEIDHEQVWKTVTEDLPPLITRLEAILAEHESR